MIVLIQFNHLKMPRPNREDRLDWLYAFKFYRKTYGNPQKLRRYKYRAIIVDFNTRLVERILFKGLSFKMPGRLSKIVLCKRSRGFSEDEDGKITRFYFFPPDWGATYRLWRANPEAKARKEVVRYLNSNTDGKVVTLVWHKYASRAYNTMWYRIRLARSVKSKLKELIDEGGASQFNLANYTKNGRTKFHQRTFRR